MLKRVAGKRMKTLLLKLFRYPHHHDHDDYVRTLYVHVLAKACVHKLYVGNQTLRSSLASKLLN